MEKVAIIGLGYVGLPVACLCIKKGFSVIGADIDTRKIAVLKEGKSPIDDPYLNEEIPKIKGKLQLFNKTEDAAKFASIIVVCVPTPVDSNHKPDLKPLENACKDLAKGLQKNALIIIESTIFPGTVEEIVKPIIDKTKVPYLLAHCPERIDPGNRKYQISNIPRVVAGIDGQSTKRAAEFYRKILDANVVELSSVKAAEATKIMENTFRDVNIAFINEMAMSFDKAGIDIMEVIKGASTKPFAFMPHYPGAGVGGHCFDGNEWIFARYDEKVYPVKIGELYELLKYYNETEIQDTLFVNPGDLQCLSFDLETKNAIYKSMRLLSKRPYKYMRTIKACGNYSIKVTDKHPVVIYNDGLKIKLADSLTAEDRLVVSLKLPAQENEITIDVLENVDPILAKKIRVKLVNGTFSDYKRILKPFISEYKYHDDFFRYDMLPLSYYLKAEKSLNIAREKIYLCTGRGPGLKKTSAILKIDRDFCRLLGYYLSEGCLTEDKTLRVRFTFNQKENEYIDDVKAILNKKGFAYSEYIDRKNHAHHMKVSSEILGVVLRDVLQCGTNCYTMAIPPKLFSLSKDHRVEIIKGILRGDAGVSCKNEKRSYAKAGKKYAHNNNTANVDYFTSSKKLQQQVMLMMYDADLIPKAGLREGLIRLHGTKNMQILENLFLGEKQQKIASYLKNIKKIINYPDVMLFDTFAAIKIESIEKSHSDYVYSVEVEDTNTLVTTNGLVMHNCIPVDPYYLIEKAKSIGFSHRFLSLAREINNSMPQYTVDLLESELKKINKKIEGAKVGVLGLAYKKNVDDMRESPALEVIDILKKKKAIVEIFDPYVKEKSTVKSFDELIKKSECIVLVTDHDLFVSQPLEAYKKNNIKIIIDGRNCLDKEKIQKLGIAYHGIGRF